MRSERNQTVTLGIIQMAMDTDTTLNMNQAAKRVTEAADRGAQIVCLPELYRTRYFPQEKRQDASSLAEIIPGESTATFSKICRERQIVVVAPLFEKGSNGKNYNTAVVIDADGEIRGTYRKVHIPQDPCFYEQDYFEPGDLGYHIFDTTYGCVGVLICYDQWFPEPARINTLMGADVIFYPTAIGWIKGYSSADGDWLQAWRTVQRAHAIENGIHVAAANRVGEEGKLKFWGGSFVCDSFGEILKEADTEKEEVLAVEVDLGMNKRIREGWGFLRNRRPDTYKLLTQRDGEART
jgi:agmatine deiminase